MGIPTDICKSEEGSLYSWVTVERLSNLVFDEFSMVKVAWCWEFHHRCMNAVNVLKNRGYFADWDFHH